MMLTSLIFGAISFITAVAAAPAALVERTLTAIDIPTGVAPPGNTTLARVFLGYGTSAFTESFLMLGTQNYTCNVTAGTFATSGTAEAVLLDISDYYLNPHSPATALPAINKLHVVGKHYYVTNPLATNTTAPAFVLDGGKKFIIATRNASVASANPTYSVANVLLHNIQPGTVGGTLADWVVRTNIVGGVVPAALNTCKAGDAIAVPYKANYLFYKSK
jgi:hypothetical protein